MPLKFARSEPGELVIDAVVARGAASARGVAAPEWGARRAPRGMSGEAPRAAGEAAPCGGAGVAVPVVALAYVVGVGAARAVDAVRSAEQSARQSADPVLNV